MSNDAARLRLLALVSPVVLVALVLIVYWQTLGHGFVRLDDEEYITRNPAVQAGLTVDSVKWAFTTTRAANWHPVTWLSHMADVQWYGLAPAGHHLTNLVLHLANVLLLYWLFASMTGEYFKSLLVAALFALHPIHVESVAWVAERKDLLSTLFGLMTIHAYVRHIGNPSRFRQATMLALFACSLMSKPMLVTLPFALLLLDYWPLRRHSGSPGNTFPVRVREKLPLIGLSLASCAVTIVSQESVGAVASFELFPFPARLGNALIASVLYIGKTVWPFSLCVFYPHPWDIYGTIPLWQPLLCALLLIAVTLLAVRMKNRYPALISGWLWYLGTLVPVIGLVQVGSQGMADRYAYVPLIGLFFAVVWSAGEAVGASVRGKRVLSALGIATVLFLSALSWRQASYWKDSDTLFSHAAKVAPESWVTQQAMGIIRAKQGRSGEAIAHLRESLRIWPGDPEARRWLAFELAKSGQVDAAIGEFYRLLESNPNDVDAYNNLGYALLERGRYDEAIAQLSKGLRIAPSNERLNANLAEATRRRSGAR
jgi:cytochrome c-type biogenesis protein CcmH/NrfG